jgi:hypothetical protein
MVDIGFKFADGFGELGEFGIGLLVIFGIG